MVLDLERGRIFIIDLNAMVHRYFNAVREKTMTATVEIDGKVVVVDTTVPALVFKQLVRLSDYGRHAIVVVHDRPTYSRKAYFNAKIAGGQITGKTVGYKGSRGYVNPQMVQSQDIIINMLKKAGVLVLGKDNYEADDLIAEVIRVAKIKYPTKPIHIVGNDMDYAPLVDEQVSFYRYTRKKESNEDGHPKLTKYAQMTVNNYQKECESVTANKKLKIPYNSLLLAKLIRGDKSDDIPPLKGWTPTKYNKLVDSLIEDGVDIANTFKYYQPKVEYVYYTETGTEVGSVLDYKEIPNEYLTIKRVRVRVNEIEEIKSWSKVLDKYMTKEEIDELYTRYHGMNLNGAFVDLGVKLNRQPIRLSIHQDILNLDVYKLQSLVSVLQINLSL